MITPKGHQFSELFVGTSGKAQLAVCVDEKRKDEQIKKDGHQPAAHAEAEIPEAVQQRRDKQTRAQILPGRLIGELDIIPLHRPLGHLRLPEVNAHVHGKKAVPRHRQQRSRYRDGKAVFRDVENILQRRKPER